LRERARLVCLSLAARHAPGAAVAISWDRRVGGALSRSPASILRPRPRHARRRLFLIYKAVHEMHDAVEAAGSHELERRARASPTRSPRSSCSTGVLARFGDHRGRHGREFWVMVTAVVIAVAIMLRPRADRALHLTPNPTVKMLALAFVLLIGFALVAEGFDFHIPKGYIYAAMAFLGDGRGAQRHRRARKRRARERPRRRRAGREHARSPTRASISHIANRVESNPSPRATPRLATRALRDAFVREATARMTRYSHDPDIPMTYVVHRSLHSSAST